MKRSQIATTASLTMLASQLSGCEAIKAIFKAGFWVGVIVVVAVLAAVAGLIRFVNR